jgi:hypothetical protein
MFRIASAPSPNHLKRLRKVVPFLSFSWGLASGFLMNRGYDRVQNLTIFTAILLVLGVILVKGVGGVNSVHLAKSKPWLQKLSSLATWLGWTVTQSQYQTVVLFCLPFCYYTKQFLLLGITLVLSVPLFWDPFWDAQVSWGPFRRIIRSWSAALAIAFLWPWVAPRYLEWITIISYAGLLITSLPFSWVFHFIFLKYPAHLNSTNPGLVRGGLSTTLVSLSPFTLWAVLIGFQKIPILPLSIWVKNPMFVTRTQIQAIKNHSLHPDKIQQLLKDIVTSEEEVCCLTPIVAPTGAKYRVMHQWEIQTDGKPTQVIDQIWLPEVTGGNTQRGYRTYSCKKAFPRVTPLQSIVCKVRLNGTMTVGEISGTTPDH